MKRATLLAAVAIGALSSGCGDVRTSVLLRILNTNEAPTPEIVQLNVYDQNRQLFVPNYRLPQDGMIPEDASNDLGSIVIYAEPTQWLRIEAHGVIGTGRVSQGVTNFAMEADKQLKEDLTLYVNTMADADVDGVPDDIDNCPQHGNFNQADSDGNGTGDACSGGGGKALGAACSEPTECTSGFCAQGVCCTSNCTGTCLTCASAASPGFCVQDPTCQ